MKQPFRLLLIPVLAAVAAVSAPAIAQQKSLDDFTQPALKDVAASIKVLSHNNAELEKIGKGYQDAYKLTDQEIWCKEPNKVRFQGKNGLMRIKYVTDGYRRLMDVSPLHVHKSEDVAKEPNKAETIADLGVMTPEWVDRVEHRWVRSEKRDNKTLQVFEYWYKADQKAVHTIWVDPATKTIVERISHHRNKNKPGFKKRLVYSDLRQVNGVWLPSLVTIFNGENRQAAQMRYDNVRVNSGLADNLFKF